LRACLFHTLPTRLLEEHVPDRPRSPVRIAAILGILDEVELLSLSVQHLRRIGVDVIIAVDNGSRDGSADLLAEYRDDDTFWVLENDPEVALDVRVWAPREIEFARRVGADWVIFLDADEFWIPASGSLRDVRHLDTADIATIDRYNVPLSTDGPRMPAEIEPAAYDELLLFIEPIPELRLRIDDEPDLAWSRGVPMPKVMARPDAISGLSPGHHAVVGLPGSRSIDGPASDLLIAHVPFTTLPRFVRKVSNIQRKMRVNPPFFAGQQAWHWRRWASIHQAGELTGEFERQVIGDDELQELRARGIVRSAAEVFRERGAAGGATGPGTVNEGRAGA
jgi:hypothetical protein